MGDGNSPTVVVDTNVLLNLATPVVDGRERAPTGADPLKTVLSVYDIHVPESVLGEVTTASDGADLLAAAADAVLRTSGHVTTHEVDPQGALAVEYGLDTGETRAIALTNDLDAAMFVTDEFNSTNYLIISLALDDRETLFTTPHVLCDLANYGVLDDRYVAAALRYFIETKHWDAQYIECLQTMYLAD